jgi:hypothetical protein
MKFNIKFKNILFVHTILLLIVFLSSLYKQLFHKKREGYQSYTDCIEQGYPNDFCLQVPPQAVIYMNK